MPTDLHAIAKEDTLHGMSTLTKSPEEVDEGRSFPLDDAADEEAMMRSMPQPNDKRDELHPYTQALSISDVESCTKLEEVTFPPNERCTREKVSRLPLVIFVNGVCALFVSPQKRRRFCHTLGQTDAYSISVRCRDAVLLASRHCLSKAREDPRAAWPSANDRECAISVFLALGASA